MRVEFHWSVWGWAPRERRRRIVVGRFPTYAAARERANTLIAAEVHLVRELLLRDGSVKSRVSAWTEPGVAPSAPHRLANSFYHDAWPVVWRSKAAIPQSLRNEVANYHLHKQESTK